ncbi:MAG TPA: choline/ethanolamine kinase family protein [Steroidobacteraceae bacterium]|jgi:thiamine kinase-like enzyme|nr:choline/ethanolamine kinase family protein [Steroidobacteraceae bacterium]
MPRSDLELLSREVVPGTGTLKIEPIGYGLFNETYRVIRDGCSFTLRLGLEPPFDLRQDLGWETRVLQAAGRAGLAPELLYDDPAQGVLVSRWVEGRSWSLEEARNCVNVGSIAGLLRRVHGLQVAQPVRLMSPPAWVDWYGAALSRAGRPPNPTLRAAAAAHLDDYSKLPSAAAVLCHSDLHTLNLIERDQSMILLDWEYAHVSEPLWDLAGWSANNDFETEAQRNLLARYHETPPTPRQWTRFKLLLWLYDYICLLWSELYLNLRPANPKVSGRLTQLDARLRVPAHYSA